MFDEFYAKYPRKIARKDAQKAWNQLRPSEREAALDAIDDHVAAWNAAETEKQFIPYPASWLRAARWEDEIEVVEKRKPKEITQAWWSSEQGMIDKGRQLGTQPRPGEDWQQFKGRLAAMIQKAA